MSLMYPSEFIGGKREDGYPGVPVHSRWVGQTGINEGRFLHGQLIFSILRVFKYITESKRHVHRSPDPGADLHAAVMLQIFT